MSDALWALTLFGLLLIVYRLTTPRAGQEWRYMLWLYNSPPHPPGQAKRKGQAKSEEHYLLTVRPLTLEWPEESCFKLISSEGVRKAGQEGTIPLQSKVMDDDWWKTLV